MSSSVTNEALRMLSDFANGACINFYVTPEGEHVREKTCKRLSKQFDKRTFKRLQDSGLITFSSVYHCGIQWLQYRISTKGWEVFNART
ncbi:hypothetical protein F9L16_21390 [Agarivorans sp. B2Z047]|uniref:hypothetical protein n=1 Tax=Agarivorans sp. B2Z047 TaxID=2652721 RepID=UPI00128DE467|nr:hypothetical protein [Agarivorans sp. B2Z047]MPW31533.1 hypothetical protein [Agarivorans sp. B2Z047]UQN42576.1 hypothetical protein LQZ07_22820 [Agarivorans sp. B2Z047]